MFNEELNEAFQSWKDHSPHYVKRNEEINIDSNVIAILKFPDGHIEPHFTHNIVVTTGDQYYAELVENGKNATGPPTNDFDTMTLGNPVGNDTIAKSDNFSNLGSPIAGSIKLIDVLGAPFDYPRLDDQDTANPGAGAFIFTWRTSYLTTDFDTDAANDVRSGVIVISTATGTDPILNHWNFTSPFAKPSTAALVVWVNHTLVGV